MRVRPAIAALLGTAALAGAAAPAAGAGLPGVIQHMTCVAPGDAAGIDAMLVRAGSPLAGEGATFVQAAADVGLDPRALVAIAAHETLLETYAPADAIDNAFGLGPGMAFASEGAAIRRAARTLGAYYLAEGRVTLGDIGSKWAPIGAANDPTGLNRNWTTGVGAYYAALGGDPVRPVLLGDQDAVACGATPSLAPAPGEPTGATTGPPVVTVWGGATPAARGASPAEGGDPTTGRPAVLEGFAFPLALPAGAPATYRDAYREPGADTCDGGRRQCAVTIAGRPGDAVVAMAAGTLRAPTAAEREAGIAFWIDTGRGDRLGYGPLAGYVPGIADGAAVTPGRPLGEGAGWLRVAWERGGVRVNPFPLLQATRPPAA
jgi:hypothetical protein